MISYKRWKNPKFLCGKSDWLPQFIGTRRHFWSATGRGALDYALSNLMLHKPGGVLLPSFVAEGVILPFMKNRISVYFYALNPDLSPSIDSINGLIKQHPDVKMMVVIHYFGVEIMNLDNVCSLAKEHGIVLVEDCAHALGSKGREGCYLGGRGDIALFSFPKSVPVPYGCLIIINDNSKFIQASVMIQYYESALWKLALILHRSFIAFQGSMLSRKRKFSRAMGIISKFLYLGYYKSICKMKNPGPIDSESMAMIKKFDYSGMIRQRRINALFLNNSIPSHLKFGFSLYDGLVMTGYPIMIENRDRVKKQLKMQGIEALAYTRAWNYIPDNATKDFNNETNILSHHLLLPISENYTLEDMKTVVKCLKEVIHENSY